jgi:MoaA/NifB/PqqE/SkfB family radical SAM enzyme
MLKNDLKTIGFYTLSDARASTASTTTPLWRCELILTGRCNFACPYCRSVGGEDTPLERAKDIVNMWCDQGLKNVRFSGGEPTMYKGLVELVALAKSRGVERIAISTNGASSMKLYHKLLEAGVTDFSISLDADNAEDGDKMAGNRRGAWKRVIATIQEMSKHTYVTIGAVLTADNVGKTEKIVEFAASLGVSDIRVIPAAQAGCRLPALNLSEEILAKYAILKYRADNIANGDQVRGLNGGTGKCGLVLDDMAVMGDHHYPCIIYMRENGAPIGKVGQNMRQERADWYKKHNSYLDPICSMNCLDVCVSYNNRFQETNPVATG